MIVLLVRVLLNLLIMRPIFFLMVFIVFYDIGYPLVKCYHPRHVQNKYTGEVIQVGCGVC